MWGFEASALASAQYFVPASLCASVDCRGRGCGAGTGDSERVLSSRSCVSFLLEWLRFWLRDEVSAKCCLCHGAFPCHRAPSNK